jgi:glycine cleavage system transcriptional repressor
MVCYFSLPPSLKIVELKNDLNRIGDESNIDIRFDAVIFK